MFEPLDALYSALYGTTPGWNVPSDITSYWNGSERSVFTLLPSYNARCLLSTDKFQKRMCKSIEAKYYLLRIIVQL